jgi:hypothetical protein
LKKELPDMLNRTTFIVIDGCNNADITLGHRADENSSVISQLCMKTCRALQETGQNHRFSQ